MAGRGGRRRARAADEDRPDDGEVGGPGDDLEPGHLGREADGALEQRGERAVGREDVADLECPAEREAGQADGDLRRWPDRSARPRCTARAGRRPPGGRGCRRPGRRRRRRSGTTLVTVKNDAQVDPDHAAVDEVAQRRPRPAGPATAPMSASGPPPNERTIDHRNSAVSMPSRATEMNPIATTPHRPPVASARAMPCSSSPFRPRAARCIQKTIARDHGHGEDRQRAAEDLLGLEAQRVGAERQDEAEARAPGRSRGRRPATGAAARHAVRSARGTRRGSR